MRTHTGGERQQVRRRNAVEHFTCSVREHTGGQRESRLESNGVTPLMAVFVCGEGAQRFAKSAGPSPVPDSDGSLFEGSGELSGQEGAGTRRVSVVDTNTSATLNTWLSATSGILLGNESNVYKSS